jgi:sugar phosphate isomerase/epimerase
MAIPLGIKVAYKGLSWSRTAHDFRTAGDLVFRANCPNLGLAIDAFDVLAAGVPLDDLDAVDPEQIFIVQLSDYMWQEARSTEEQAATATHFRVFPGEGAHSEALAQFVTKLDAYGYYGDYSFDVYNDDYLQMPPETVAQRALRAAEWLGETVLRRTLPVPNMERLLRRTGA